MASKSNGYRLAEGDVLAGKYRVQYFLGAGWEGEVYLVKELGTGIEHAAKIFYPKRNERDTALRVYAKKLHKLRHCKLVIHYYTREQLAMDDGEVRTCLISEFVEGELLSEFIKRQPGKRLHPFQALHLLHALAKGMEEIHQRREYHGDLHSENIIVQRYGLGFDLRLVDFYQWKTPKPENIQADICQMIRIFYDALGGAEQYPKHSPAIKSICLGLRRDLILKKFRTSAKLRSYIENMVWE